MSDDDTPTERRRKPDDRGLSSAERRRLASRAAPVDELVVDVTSPIDLLSREPDADEMDLIARSQYEAGDPVSMRDFAKVLKRIQKLQLDERSNNRERGEQLVQLLSEAPGGKVREEVRDLTRDMRLVKWAAGAAVAAALGSLASVAARIWDRAEREGETTIRLKHIESAIERLQDRPTRNTP